MGEQGSGPNLFPGIPPPELAQQLSLAPAPQTGSDDPWSETYVNPRVAQMNDDDWKFLIRAVTAIIRHHGTDKDGKHLFAREDGRGHGEPMSLQYIDSLLRHRSGRHVLPPLTRVLAKELLEKEPRFSPILLENPMTKITEACIACQPSRHHRSHRPRTM